MRVVPLMMIEVDVINRSYSAELSPPVVLCLTLVAERFLQMRTLG